MTRNAICALLAALTLVACNGDDPEPDNEAANQKSALSKSEYIAEADAICEDAETAINNLDPPTTNDELDEYADDIIEISDEAIADLRALRSPPRDAQVLGRMIDNIERSLELVPDYVRATQAEDIPQLQEIEGELQAIQDETAQLARAYGFEDCGGDEGAPQS